MVFDAVSVNLSAFTTDRLDEIVQGLESGVDVGVYAKTIFNSSQMREIRLGLEHGFDVSGYAVRSLSPFGMEKSFKRLLVESRLGKLG